MSGTIDYSRTPTAPSWDLKEFVFFRAIENDLLERANEMLYMEHVTLAAPATGDAFRDEIEGAQSKFNTCGRLLMPWLQWAPMKTAAQAYREAQERRKDPDHKAMLQKLQADLDNQAKELSDAVKAEVEVRKQAVEHAHKFKLTNRRRRRHGGVPRTTAKTKRRRR